MIKYNGNAYKTDKTIKFNGHTYYSPYSPVTSSPLCFTANTAGSTVELTAVGSPSITDTAYSTDGSTWTTFTPSTTSGTNKITLTNAGDKVYFKNNITGNFNLSNYLKFVTSGSVSASGNVNSIYDATNFDSLTTLSYSYCYLCMFYNCTSLTSAPALPATTLATYCYQEMFAGCTSLTTAPTTLPATTLAEGCYYYMFSRCTSLTTAPALPATTLSSSCYRYMFTSCTSLTTPPALPATTLAEGCYYGMFTSCTSLTTAPALPATTLSSSCYRYMFQSCTSLTTAPALPATTLSSSCYRYMFYNCTSLYVSDTQSTEAQYPWQMPSLGTFTNTYSQSNMFTNCLGSRSSNDMAGITGNQYTYYTQNKPQ